MKLSVFVFSILMCPAIAIAHHSRAEFSQEFGEIEGELVSVRWVQPHPRFTVNVTNDEGGTELWRIEGFGSIYTLSRAGVSNDYFTLGEQVRIAGQPSARRDNVFLASNMLLSNGNEIVLNGGAAPHWNEEAIGGRANWEAKAEDLVDAAAENRGLFRIWSQPNRNADTTGLDGEALSLHLPWNEAAIAKQAAWDPLDDPDIQCIPKGMPVVMVTPHPFTFSKEGSNIKILAHEYAVERIIYMEDANNPDQLSRTPVGYSVGRWEGDTLVVETSQIDESNFFFFGFRLGDSVEVVERMTLSEDQGRLDYSAVITDPMSFTEPARIERYWVALGEAPELFECAVDGV